MTRKNGPFDIASVSPLFPASGNSQFRVPLLRAAVGQRIRQAFSGVLSGTRFESAAHRAQSDPIAPVIARALLAAEVEALPREQCLVHTGAYRVFCARAAQVPWCLQEIGRLREISFRSAGEGTGRAADIDVFDACYLHLFVWNSESEEIVGAYRIGLTDEIVARYGRRGLYTYSLFKYGSRFLQCLDPALELGRSFVRPEYQRRHGALMLLWRGIGEYIARNPRYAVLFGPVSVSNSYAPRSRELIVEFLKANSIEPTLARYVKPRNPFRPRWSLLGFDGSHQMDGLRDIEDLSRLVETIEADGKGVPVLLIQYLKLGGRLLGFNIDPEFSDALDGLIMVDLRAADPRMLARYMGHDGAAAYLSYQVAVDGARRAS
jgi:putative hemolysin